MKLLRPQADASEGGNNMEWLTTFNDLMTLLMVFFVLLFTMSSIDTQKLKDFQSALQSGLGVLGEGQLTGIGVLQIEPIGQLDADATEKLYETLEDTEDADETGPSTDKADTEEKSVPSDVQTDPQEQRMRAAAAIIHALPEVSATYADQSICITLKDRVLFALGSADIHPEARAVLDRLITVIEPLPNAIRIEGHTDNVPIRSGRYFSNWELSVQRAVNMVKYFIQSGRVSPQRMSAAGYGAAKPIAPNDTAAHRALNRRVEIILNMEETE